MESKFKKILLQSTVFTCLSSGVTVTMGLDPIRETEVVDGYIDHHNTHFAGIADNNPAMKAIKAQQLAHRDTVMADVTLMLGAITDRTVQENLDKLKNMIGAALTADADAINDIEDRHEAKTATETAETLLTKANLYKGAMTKTDAMFGAETAIPAFNPTAEITRAEAAVMIARMHGYKDSDASSYTNFFDDVSATHWAAGQINYLKSKGIVSGTSDTTFNPDANVTREEMATMVAKAKDYPAEYVSTTDIVGTHSDWAPSYIQYAIDRGFMSTSDDYTDNMTRADVATMVAKAAGYTTAYTPVNNLFSDVGTSNSAAAYISYLADKDIIRVKRSETNSTIQHYRLAYFLMLKLQPWLAENYENDPVEADELLKDHIPTHYPEWISTQILQKKLAVELVGNTVTSIGNVTVSFPVAKTILTGTKVYKYNGTNGTAVTGASVEAITTGTSAQVTGLTEYGVYYVEIGTGTDADPKHKYYFSVKNTTVADQFVYGDTVKVKSTPNDGLKALANSKEITPKLTLKLNGTAVDESTFTASLDGTTWKTLSEFADDDFLKGNQTIEFKDLGVGNYTFEVGSPTPQRFATQSTSFKVLPQIISLSAIAQSRDYKAGDKSALAALSPPYPGVKVNSATFDDGSVGIGKEVTVYAGYNLDTAAGDVISQKDRENSLLIPEVHTTANITQPVTTTTGTGGTGGTGGTSGGSTPTTPEIEFLAIIPNTGSPYLKATGTVSNIAAGTYNVSIPTADNPSGTGTIVVANDGSFYVSLFGLTFAAAGENVIVKITDTGAYFGTEFTFTSPTITPAFTNAIDGQGTVEFTVGSAFNGILPSFALVGDVASYSGNSTITSGKVTRNYTPSKLGNISTTGRINIDGTNFTFTGTKTSTLSLDSNFVMNGSSTYATLPTSAFSIGDLSELVPDGASITNITVDSDIDGNIPVVSNTGTLGNHSFTITLDGGATMNNDTTITFEYNGNTYTVSYVAAPW